MALGMILLSSGMLSYFIAYTYIFLSARLLIFSLLQKITFRRM